MESAIDRGKDISVFGVKNEVNEVQEKLKTLNQAGNRLSIKQESPSTSSDTNRDDSKLDNNLFGWPDVNTNLKIDNINKEENVDINDIDIKGKSVRDDKELNQDDNTNKIGQEELENEKKKDLTIDVVENKNKMEENRNSKPTVNQNEIRNNLENNNQDKQDEDVVVDQTKHDQTMLNTKIETELTSVSGDRELKKEEPSQDKHAPSIEHELFYSF